MNTHDLYVELLTLHIRMQETQHQLVVFLIDKNKGEMNIKQRIVYYYFWYVGEMGRDCGRFRLCASSSYEGPRLCGSSYRGCVGEYDRLLNPSGWNSILGFFSKREMYSWACRNSASCCEQRWFFTAFKASSALRRRFRFL